MHTHQRTVHEQFLHAFGEFWRADPGPRMLSDLRKSTCLHCAAVGGWTQGGCWVAACGIQRYIVHSCEAATVGLKVSLVAVATDETEAAHVLVALYKDGDERFLDATGMWTREALLCRLAQEYPFDDYSLVPWEKVVLDRVRIPFNAQIAQSVEVALVRVLGPFTPDFLFPASALGTACLRPRAPTAAWQERSHLFQIQRCMKPHTRTMS